MAVPVFRLPQFSQYIERLPWVKAPVSSSAAIPLHDAVMRHDIHHEMRMPICVVV